MIDLLGLLDSQLTLALGAAGRLVLALAWGGLGMVLLWRLPSLLREARAWLRRENETMSTNSPDPPMPQGPP